MLMPAPQATPVSYGQTPPNHCLQGGELLLQHGGQDLTWDTAAGSASEFQYAAFYADAQHELRPVASGARVLLVYSLVYSGPGSAPTAAGGWDTVAELAGVAAAWEAEALAAANSATRSAANSAPSSAASLAASTIANTGAYLLAKLGGASAPAPLCVPLSGWYDREGDLSLEGLKGGDVHLVQQLLCHPGSNLDVHLALVKRTVTKVIRSCYNPYYQQHKRRHWSCREQQQLEPGTVVGTPRTSCGPWLAPCGARMQPLPSSCTAGDAGGGTGARGGGGAGSRGSSAGWHMELLGGGELFGEEDMEHAVDEGETRYMEEDGTPIVDYVYHRAVAILWPRALAPYALAPAGLAGAVQLLEMRLHTGSAAEVEGAVAGVMTAFAARPKGGCAELTERTLLVLSGAPAELAATAAAVIVSQLAAWGAEGIATDGCAGGWFVHQH